MTTASNEGVAVVHGKASSFPRLGHLDLLRGAAIMMVVGIHAAGYAGEPSTFFDLHIHRVWANLATIAVPGFFFCDGYLAHFGRLRPFKEVVRRSAHRLLIPWMIFTVLYLIARALGETRGVFGSPNLVIGRQPSEILLAIWNSTIAMQMYFLPALFLVRLTGIVWRPLAGLHPAWTLIAAVAYNLAYVLLGIPLGSDPLTQCASGLRYYLLGMVAFRLEPWIRRNLGFAILALAWLMTTTFVLRESGVQFSPFQFVYLITAYLASLGLESRFVLVGRIGRMSMGIYLLHAPPLMKSVQLAVSPLGWGWSANFVAITLLSLIGAVAVTHWILKTPDFDFSLGFICHDAWTLFGANWPSKLDGGVDLIRPSFAP